MTWYYVDAGQQAGPVDDAQLEELARNGKVLSDTLVWREGLANWQPYRDATSQGTGMATAPLTIGGTTATAPTSEAVCAECGRIFAMQDMIHYGTAYVCANCKPIFMQKLAEGAVLNTGALNYAGFWIRLGAKLIDGLILGLIFVAPLVYLVIKSASGGQSTALLGLRLLLQLGYMAGNIGYQIFFLGKYGATPGKMACGLRVVTSDGARISYGRAAGRGCAEILSGLICNIGYIIAAFDKEKRALHDHICNTRVIFKQ